MFLKYVHMFEYIIVGEYLLDIEGFQIRPYLHKVGIILVVQIHQIVRVFDQERYMIGIFDR